ncbi:MAG: hypothetical protein R3324_14670, partial [Halobacteriales archaeon]|nr:hypothetical protein [Halobacteriales archaeon]
MSLFPYAPVGAYPGEYTHCTDRDDPDCGLKAATGGTRGNLEIPTRKRLTTHNMTGVDIALGHTEPIDVFTDTPSVMLPNQTTSDSQDENPTRQDDEVFDMEYELPLSLDARRVKLLENSMAISLAGTPDKLERGLPREECEESRTCCDPDTGVCSLPVKAWVTNVNGGHNVAAGFSQERQIWVEFTVQDMGTMIEGEPALVDCSLVEGIHELYEDFDTSTPVRHTAASATDIVHRSTAIDTTTGDFDHDANCRGLSGHLIDKPHTETTEMEADGLLDDEDIMLHRIGNTLPEYENGMEGISWHIIDLGRDVENEDGDHMTGNFEVDGIDSARVARPDQFHIPGLDAFQCQLTQEYPDPALEELPVTLADGSSVTVGEAGKYKYAVTLTSDERLEIL